MNRREFFRRLLLACASTTAIPWIRPLAAAILAWEKRRAEIRAYEFGRLNHALKLIFQEPLTENIIDDSELLEIFENDMNVRTDEESGGKYIQLAHYFKLSDT